VDNQPRAFLFYHPRQILKEVVETSDAIRIRFWPILLLQPESTAQLWYASNLSAAVLYWKSHDGHVGRLIGKRALRALTRVEV